MSYDLCVAVKVEGCGKYAEISTPEYDNPTYNLRNMFVACMDWDYHQGEYYKCSEYLPVLEKGIKRLLTEDFTKYNSSNGWGTTVDAFYSLESWRKCIYEAAEEIPLECLYMRW